MLHPNPRRPLAFGTLACLLAGLIVAPACADDIRISATLGIGGHYRTGTWLPITVSVVNTGADAVHGQVQVFDDDPLGGANSLFARPADVAASGPAPQTFQVYARDLNADRGNVVAQLVSDAGGGRVLARTSSLSTTGRPGFSGLAISDRDLFLVGFSADVSAFTFLNGQKWGLTHTSAGLAPEPPTLVPTPGGSPIMAGRLPTPASVQAVAAAPTELPDKAAGYEGVDAVLLRADAPLDSLTEGQTDALKAWVNAGGHLIVCGGPDPTPLSNAFYTGLLPASISPVLGAGNVLGLTPKPLPGVRVLARAGGRPTIVEGPSGAGRVTLLSYDTQTIRGWSGSAQAAFWKGALSGQPSSLLRVVANREEAGSRTFGPYYGGSAQLSEAVMRAPALDAPGAGVVGLFLLAYVLVLVPINYLVLKRLDKKEWAWVTVPALVVAFAVTTYGVGYAAKGSSVFVNRAAVVETTAGERQAGLYTEIGLFSPHRTTYDMTVADPNGLAAIPVPPDQNYYGRGNQTPVGAYGQTRFVETASDTKMQDAAVNMWAMRAFDVQTTTDLGGAVTAALNFKPQTGLMQGTLTNRTPHALTECHLFANGQWQPIPDLPPGATAAVFASFPAVPLRGGGPQAWAMMPTILGRNDKNDPDSDVRQRMRAALHDFLRDLGNDPTNGQYQYYGGNYTPPALFQPQAGEAVLTAWSADDSLPGPALRVDGHPVTQNNVTFVVIHIPLQ